MLCFYFVFRRLVYLMLSVYLECQLLIAPSVFSNGYLRNRNYLPFASTWVYPRLVFSGGGRVALLLVFVLCCLLLLFYMFLFCVLFSMLPASLDYQYMATPLIFSKFCLTLFSKTQLEETEEKLIRLKEN